MDQVMVIGIAGGTGSGKTTITRRLMQRFGGDVSVIYHDNYYKAHHDMPYEERAKLNYDHPDAFDTDLLIEAVRELKAGRAVTCPVYDYTVHDRSSETVTVRGCDGYEAFGRQPRSYTTRHRPAEGRFTVWDIECPRRTTANFVPFVV